MKKPKDSIQKSLPGMSKTLGSKSSPRRYFEAVRLQRDKAPGFETYPFSVPSIRHLTRLEFHPAVTFFVGDNGSGRSTLLKAIAVKAGFSAEGGDQQLQFGTHDTHSPLHDCLTLEQTFGRPTGGFFLRAERFYNVASELEKLGSSFLGYSGKPLHQPSHGESFLAVLKERLQGGGDYLFDERRNCVFSAKTVECVDFDAPTRFASVPTNHCNSLADSSRISAGENLALFRDRHHRSEVYGPGTLSDH